MADTVKWNFGKVDKAFKKTAEYANLVKVGIAAVQHLTDGGFKEKIAARQSSWKELNPYYLRRKTRQGGSADKWAHKGKLLKALHGNQLTKTGTTKGFQYRLKVSSKVTKAIFKPTTFGHHLKKKPNAAMKNRIHSLLDYRRPLFRWDRPDQAKMEKNIAKAIQESLNKAGIGK